MNVSGKVKNDEYDFVASRTQSISIFHFSSLGPLICAPKVISTILVHKMRIIVTLLLPESKILMLIQFFKNNVLFSCFHRQNLTAFCTKVLIGFNMQ